MRLHNSNRKKARRRIPQLNTVATADISFMLLIFFLLTTSMNKEQGLARQLPPQEVENENVPTNVEKERVLTVSITSDSKYAVNDTILTETELAENMTEFIRNKGKEHIIELKADKNANYEAYFKLQNIIVNTYRSLRNAEAQRLFKKQMTECTEEQQEKIRQEFPQHITEEFIETNR